MHTTIKSEIFKVDGFRFLSSLHTTARQLKICSQITYELNESKKIKKSLYDSLINWSLEKEKNDNQYSISKGKLTEHEKPTTAFTHYLDLSKSLGLINELNGVFSNNRLSYTLLYFLSKSKTGRDIEYAEMYFYLYIILMKDADGILLILTVLNKGNINQKTLQNNFQEALNERLLAKRTLSNNYVKAVINEKYRAINYIWRKPGKYAEHLLVPRCEWLSQLELISIIKLKGSTLYSLTEKGALMLKSLPLISNTNLVDIDDKWMVDSVFTTIHDVFQKNFFSETEHYNETFISHLGKAIEKSTYIIKSSNLFRVPSFDCLLFTCLYMLVENNIVINFSDIINVLNNGLTHNGRVYLVKNAGRINESYITTRQSQ